MCWAAKEFEEVDLGDKRLDARLVKLCESFSEAPESPIMSVVAWRLFMVTLIARTNPAMPCSAFLTETMRDLLGLDTFSEGTLANLLRDSSERLESVDEHIRSLVAAAPVAGFDETGIRSEGRLHWLHTVSTDFLTWFFAHPKRGAEAMDEAGVLPEFTGNAVHDFWKPYLRYENCRRSFCNAHILRELLFLYEEKYQLWAAEMKDHLQDIKEAVDTARDTEAGQLSPEMLAGFQEEYYRILLDGYSKNPEPVRPPGSKGKARRKQSKARNLLDRLRDHSGEVLAFMYDLRVPFDNNQAERDIRMAKLRQKISGTFRTADGLGIFCRIRSYVSTARKNGLTAIESLSSLFQGTPFLPGPVPDP
jgi:transposase